jgi:hypothetical protein
MHLHPTSFHIKPAPGLRIADPQSGEYLPEAGALMPRSAFWLRRLADGDVVEGSAPLCRDASSGFAFCSGHAPQECTPVAKSAPSSPDAKARRSRERQNCSNILEE